MTKHTLTEEIKQSEQEKQLKNKKFIIITIIILIINTFAGIALQKYFELGIMQSLSMYWFGAMIAMAQMVNTGRNLELE